MRMGAPEPSLSPPMEKPRARPLSMLECDSEEQSSLAANPELPPLRRAVTDTSAPPMASPYHPNGPLPALPLPPPYDDPDGLRLPRPRFKVFPREEEGREALPAYTCSLHREAVLEQKMELTSPFERAGRRRWRKVYVVLHGTLLRIHKPKKAGMFDAPAQHEKEGRAEGYMPGELLASYTMQLAEVGIAADYKKRTFVIRLRAETDQFLLTLPSVVAALDWLESLSASISLSPCLEERSLPTHKTIPRRRRRRRHATTPRDPATEQLLLEQAAIIRRDFPHLYAQDTPGQDNPDNSDISPPISPLCDSMPIGLDLLPGPQRTRDFPSFASRSSPALVGAEERAFDLSRRRTSGEDEEDDDRYFDESGKWAPPHTISEEAQLRYARRCMTILAENTPRQSEFVVVDGKRYRLRWDTRELVLIKTCDRDQTRVKSLSRTKSLTRSKSQILRGQKENDPASQPPVPLPSPPEYAEAMGQIIIGQAL